MAVTLTNMLLLALLVFILVLVIRTRKLFPVVVLAGAYSLVSAAMFVNLDAVDVAFTEAAVGAGISTVLFLAAMAYLPGTEKEPPEAKCKDKFQVLSLPLSAEHSQQLKELADEPHRALLNEIWKGDGAKEAQIAKIRCSFVAEPAPRSETIPEEGPVSPFSPEPTVAAAAAATPAAATPAAAPTPSVAGTPAGGSSTTAEELQARARNSCRAQFSDRAIL